MNQISLNRKNREKIRRSNLIPNVSHHPNPFLSSLVELPESFLGLRDELEP